MLPVQAAEIVNTFLGEPAFVILQQSIAKDAICGSISLGDGVSCGLEFYGVFPRKKGEMECAAATSASSIRVKTRERVLIFMFTVCP